MQPGFSISSPPFTLPLPFAALGACGSISRSYFGTRGLVRRSEASHPFQTPDSSEGKVLSGELNPHLRLLLGPGPSPVHPRILKAMSTHVVGHLDPDFLSVMDDCQTMLRDLFNTGNQVTFPVSGHGQRGDGSVRL